MGIFSSLYFAHSDKNAPCRLFIKAKVQHRQCALSCSFERCNPQCAPLVDQFAHCLRVISSLHMFSHTKTFSIKPSVRSLRLCHKWMQVWVDKVKTVLCRTQFRNPQGAAEAISSNCNAWIWSGSFVLSPPFSPPYCHFPPQNVKRSRISVKINFQKARFPEC